MLAESIVCKDLQKVINIMPDIVLVTDKSNKIVMANIKALNALYYTIEEIFDKKVINYINKNKNNEFAEKWFDDNLGDSYVHSIQLMAKSGFTIDVNLDIKKINNDNNKLLIFKTIKDQKTIEDWFMTYLSNTHSAVYLAELGTGNIVNTNEYATTIVGFQREELIGHNIVELGMIAAEEREEYIQILNSGKEIHNKYANIISKTGEKKTVTFSAKLVYSDNNQYNLVTFADVTEIDTLREKSEERKQFLRMLFDTVNSAIIVYDVINNGETGYDYLIKDMNAAAMHIEGLDINEAKGHPIKKFRKQVDEYGIIDIFRQVWKTGKPEFIEAKPYEENNRVTWFENRIFRLETGEIVVVYDDVTNRVNSEKRIEQQFLMENLIKDIAVLGLENLTLDEFIHRSLALLGKQLNASRTNVYVNNNENNTVSKKYEWTNKGIETNKERSQNIKNSEMHFTILNMKKNRIISYTNINDISDKMTREIFINEKLKALTLLPIFVRGRYYGFMSYTDCSIYRTWVNTDLLALKAISSIISEVITRYEIQTSLAESEFMMRSQFDYGAVGIMILNKYGRTININKKALEIMGYTRAQIQCVNWIDVVYKDDRRSTIILFNELTMGKTDNIKQEMRLIKSDGNTVYIVLTGSCYRDENDDVNMVFFTILDITEQKNLENQLFAEKEQLRTTLKSIGDGVLATDNDEKIVMINTVAEKLLGWEYEQAIGKNVSEVFDIYNYETRMPTENPIRKVLNTGKSMELAENTMLKSADGTERLIADSAAPIKNAKGETDGVVLVFRDVTEEKMRNDEIMYISQHDKLTGLYNRRYFEGKLKEFEEENRYPISLIMGDLNGLKITNDVFGHDVGDELLTKIADVLRKHARTQDVLARWGGDEYVMLMPETTLEKARQITRKIYSTCGKYEDAISNEVTPLSISLGYATHEDNSKELVQLIKAAEDFMYKGKLLESRSTHSNIISSIKNTLFEKSHETEAHAERLKNICEMIGEGIGLAEQQLNDLALLAMLHDIGKITIDDNILTKRGKLTPEEWQIMERHPATGYRIIQSAPELSHIADYILAHHERWDGKGYPHNLAGKEIPLLSRILAIGDSYDAMISDRPYGLCLQKEKALAEIKKCSGKQFDPDLVEAFMKITDKI